MVNGMKHVIGALLDDGFSSTSLDADLAMELGFQFTKMPRTVYGQNGATMEMAGNIQLTMENGDVPSKQNHADHGTRPTGIQDFKEFFPRWIQSADYELAEQELALSVQNQWFAKEKQQCRAKGGSTLSRQGLLRKRIIFLDKTGLLRCRSRDAHDKEEVFKGQGPSLWTRGQTCNLSKKLLAWSKNMSSWRLQSRSLQPQRRKVFAYTDRWPFEVPSEGAV